MSLKQKVGLLARFFIVFPLSFIACHERTKTHESFKNIAFSIDTLAIDINENQLPAYDYFSIIEVIRSYIMVITKDFIKSIYFLLATRYLLNQFL